MYDSRGLGPVWGTDTLEHKAAQSLQVSSQCWSLDRMGSVNVSRGAGPMRCGRTFNVEAVNGLVTIFAKPSLDSNSPHSTGSGPAE